jgi:ribosomal 30S subunit maturation factor RimM
VKTADGREALVPFVGSFCKKIDVAGKVIQMDLPEGLLDA